MKAVMVMMVMMVAMVGCVAAEQATVQIQMNSHNGIVSNTAVVDGQTVQVYPDGSSETVVVEAGRTIIVTVPVGNGEQPEQMTVEVVRGLNVVRPQGQANPTAPAGAIKGHGDEVRIVSAIYTGAVNICGDPDGNGVVDITAQIVGKHGTITTSGGDVFVDGVSITDGQDMSYGFVKEVVITFSDGHKMIVMEDDAEAYGVEGPMSGTI